MLRVARIVGVLMLLSPMAQADLVPGVISDFDDGTAQGWLPGDILSNPSDYLQITPRVGFRANLAAFNTGVAGTISPLVTSISVDMMRPDGESDLDMRLVLFGASTNERWTSTAAQTVAGNGLWQTYDFSVLVGDLNRVQGVADFANLTANLNRIMFRLDSGGPSAGGEPAAGSLGIDNVIANPVPIPAAIWFLLSGAGYLMSRRRTNA